MPSLSSTLSCLLSSATVALLLSLYGCVASTRSNRSKHPKVRPCDGQGLPNQTDVRTCMAIDAACSTRPIGTLVFKGESLALPFGPELKEEAIDRPGSREINPVDTKRFDNVPSRAD